MIYQLKIQIKDIKNPPVWRRILIPCNASFEDLHNVIQAAFDWENRHLNCFQEKIDYKPGKHLGWRISTDDEGDLDDFYSNYDNYNSNETAIAEFLNPMCDKIYYEYDFGDSWYHIITLENAYFDKDYDTKHAHCIDGKGVRPPEDCGSVWGFIELRDFILANPEKALQAARGELSEEEIMEDEEGLGTARWAGVFYGLINGKPDFSKFDLEETEERVSKVRLSNLKFKSRNRHLAEFQEGYCPQKSRKRNLSEADKDEVRQICKDVFLEIFGLKIKK